MLNKEQKDVWSDIQSTWNNSVHAQDINVKAKRLIDELTTKVTPLEKRLIKADIERVKNSISEFEKNSIDRDLKLLTTSLKKFMGLFRKEK